MFEKTRRDEAWELRCEELKHWYERHPVGHPPKGTFLHNWVKRQRQAARDKTLSPRRYSKLMVMDRWEWEPPKLQDENWNHVYQALELWLEQHGSYPPLVSYLGLWLERQEILHSKRELPADRKQALESLEGWDWTAWEGWAWDWDIMVQKAAEWYDIYTRHPPGWSALGTWISLRRTQKRKGKLSKEQRKALEAINGWEWTPTRHNPRRWTWVEMGLVQESKPSKKI